MSSMYKFSLDSSSKKHQCPSCRQRTFVVYLDNESRDPVDALQYGRCDRENSCGYHQAPWMDPELAAKTKAEFVPTPDPELRQIYPDQETIDRITTRTRTCVSPLHQYLNKKTVSNDHLIRLGVYSDEDKTVYVFRNVDQKVVNLKWFKYKDDGHRDKNFNSYSLKNPKTPQPPQKDGFPEFVEKYKLCLFGEHLLDPEKQKKVMVVESEKTAAIASFFYPQYDWVSCASNNGLTDEKIRVLHNRTVYWLCDADDAGRRNKSIERATQYLAEFYVVDLFPDRNDGYDIADAIADGVRPEIKVTYKGADKKAEMQKLEYNEKMQYDLPEGCDFEKVIGDIRKYMHFEHAGKIYIVRKRKSGGGAGDFEDRGLAPFYSAAITNFTIKSLGLIASELEPFRLVEVRNIHGLRKEIQVPTKAFTSQTEFRTFIESVGNFQYDGVGNDLNKIRSRIYDTMLTYEEVKRLGWQNGHFLFANGVYSAADGFKPIDEYGFVRLKQTNFFIQPLSCISRVNSDEWEDEKKFIYRRRDDVNLESWATLFCKVHKANGQIAFAWYVTSLFRDFIYQRFRFFPHLFLFGPPATGKSLVAWSIRALGFFGTKKPFNLNSGTDVSFFREMGQYVNFPCWYDEFGLGMEWKRSEALKNAYDGAGHAKAVEKSETRSKKTPVHSACLISGQALPVMDNALFKRVILLQFYQTEYSVQERYLYLQLRQMEEGGLSQITAGFMHFRSLIEEKYLDQFEVVLSEMIADAKEMRIDVEDRILRNSCICLTTIKLLESDERISNKLPYTYSELRKVIMKNIKEQMNLITTSNETNAFWEMVEFLYREGKIKAEDDFKILEKRILKLQGAEQTLDLGKSIPVLLIRFSRVFPLYREYFKRQNSNTASPMDQGSMVHYLKHSKSYLGTVDRIRFNGSNPTTAYAFDYNQLRIDLGQARNEVLDDASDGEPAKRDSLSHNAAQSIIRQGKLAEHAVQTVISGIGPG